jgi:hypothetical protein
MLIDVTRSRSIQVWFAAVALIVAASVVLGASVTVGTAAVLMALCLAPPAIILMLWPGAQSATVADVIHGADRRG